MYCFVGGEVRAWDAPHELVGLPEISGSLVSRVVGWCSEVVSGLVVSMD